MSDVVVGRGTLGHALGPMWSMWQRGMRVRGWLGHGMLCREWCRWSRAQELCAELLALFALSCAFGFLASVSMPPVLAEARAPALPAPAAQTAVLADL